MYTILFKSNQWRYKVSKDNFKIGSSSIAAVSNGSNFKVDVKNYKDIKSIDEGNVVAAFDALHLLFKSYRIEPNSTVKLVLLSTITKRCFDINKRSLITSKKILKGMESLRQLIKRYEEKYSIKIQLVDGLLDSYCENYVSTLNKYSDLSVKKADDLNVAEREYIDAFNRHKEAKLKYLEVEKKAIAERTERAQNTRWVTVAFDDSTRYDKALIDLNSILLEKHHELNRAENKRNAAYDNTFKNLLSNNYF